MTASQGALARVQGRGRFGIRLGLGRTRAMLRSLGDPQDSLRGVLIGGTNGKGSCQQMVAAMLRAAGSRVGQTPKPHLVDYGERIVVDGAPIGSAALEALLEEVLQAADRAERAQGPATEFELLTVAAFTWLARCDVDVAVVEVGLGGRLDATNAWDGGVAAITNVALDHQEHLGDSLEAIAREKAAIIKRGDRAVSGAQGMAARIVARRAHRLGVPLRAVQALPVERMDLEGLTVHHPVLGPLEVALLGRHQAHNVAVAIAIVEELAAAGIAAVDGHAIRAGLAAVRWPGRLEVAWTADRLVLLDGAHNPDGAVALAAALDELGPSLPVGRPTLLLGILRDKDVRGMLEPLARWAQASGARIICTSVPDTSRSLSGAELGEAWQAASRGRMTVIEDADAALEAALDFGGPVVVCGSLYLVGHVRGRIVPGLPT